MIEARNVTKRFGEYVALDDVSVAVESGSLTALLGPSGSGKSTLLRVIAGLEQPDGGDVFISGREATAVAPQKRGVGFVFQHYAAFKHMTVRNNVAFGLEIRKRPRREIDRRVGELLELVQLSGFADRYPAHLSGGQRQRMALARALAVEPEDDEVHVTTIFVTHDQEEAMDLADRIVVMSNGRVEQVGAPRELYEEPANEFVMTFVGEVNRLGESFIRPHDVELRLDANGATVEAVVERVVHLGFEVRVELRLEGGDDLWAQVTRDEAERLGLEEGARVHVRPRKAKVFG